MPDHFFEKKLNEQRKFKTNSESQYYLIKYIKYICIHKKMLTFNFYSAIPNTMWANDSSHFPIHHQGTRFVENKRKHLKYMFTYHFSLSYLSAPPWFSWPQLLHAVPAPVPFHLAPQWTRVLTTLGLNTPPALIQLYPCFLRLIPPVLLFPLNFCLPRLELLLSATE